MSGNPSNPGGLESTSEKPEVPDALLGMSDGTKLAIQALKSLEKKQSVLDKDYARERLALEKKYAELQEPLYERRTSIVNGASAPEFSELAAGEAVMKEEFPGYTTPPQWAVGDIPRIADFWLTVLQHSEDISFLISEDDEEALKHLTNIRCHYLTGLGDPDPSFRLSFYFTENKFFHGTVLQKEYHYRRLDSDADDDWEFDRAEATKIIWKTGVDLVKTREGKDRVSFFDFFYPATPLSGGDVKDSKHKVDHLESLASENDLHVGLVFKDDIIPNALDLFIYPESGEDDDDEEDDDDDLDDDDDDDDD